MSIALLARDVADSIRSQPTRFALSGFAIAVGIVSLVLLLAVLAALNAKSDRLVQDLGADVVGVLAPDSPKPGEGLLQHHADLVGESFSGIRVSTIRRFFVPTLGTHAQLTVVATDDKLDDIRGWPLAAGRFLDQRDLADGRRHAVVTRALGESWGWKVGNIIYLRDTPFTIVGIVEAGGDALDAEESDPRLALGDRVVMVPRTVRPYWSQSASDPGGTIDALFIKYGSRRAETFVESLRSLLEHPDQKAGTLAWVTSASLLAEVDRLKTSITLTAGAVAALCLALGGTALMSLMIANVQDRVGEIGLRRALGASRLDIAMLFAIESLAVTVVAGIAGTVLAHIILLLTAGSWPMPVSYGPSTILIPPLAAAAIGSLASWWPARSAARIAPAEALRND